MDPATAFGLILTGVAALNTALSGGALVKMGSVGSSVEALARRLQETDERLLRHSGAIDRHTVELALLPDKFQALVESSARFQARMEERLEDLCREVREWRGDERRGRGEGDRRDPP